MERKSKTLETEKELKDGRRKSVGLTLTSATRERLEKICEITGMTKSAVISMCINMYAFEKLGFKSN
jgi:predicted DNA-binding protein